MIEPSIFFIHGVLCISDTNSTINIHPKIFLDCQNANIQFTQVSNDNVDNVRSCSLTLTDTVIYIFPAIWSLSYSIFAEILRKFMDLLCIIFIYRLCGISVIVTKTSYVPCWGRRNGLQTWSVAENILNKQSTDRSEILVLQLCVWTRF